MTAELKKHWIRRGTGMIIEANNYFSIVKTDDISTVASGFDGVTLAYINIGTLFFKVDQNEFQLFPSQVFIINPDNNTEIKNASRDADLEIYLIELNMYQVQSLLEKSFARFSNLEEHDSKEWVDICREMEALIEYYEGNRNRDNSKLMQNYFFCRILKSMIPFLMTEQDAVFGEASGIVNEIFWYIQEHYSERITLQEIAEKYYVSDSTLSRWVKQYCGMNYEKYIRKLKASHCALEISNTEKSMLEIALQYGFANPAAMNKAFHEFYHMTPGQYRKEHKPHWEKGTVFIMIYYFEMPI